MLKNYIYAAIFSIVGLIIIGFIVKNEVGDIRPALLPSPQITTAIKDREESLPSADLRLPSGFRTYILASGLQQIRDLQLSPGGTLLASIFDAGKVVSVDSQGGTKEVITGLSRPHGLAFYRDYLVVAEERQVVRYHWDESHTIAQLDKVLFNLPQGGRHNTRSVVIDSTGKMYVSIGSTCDVCVESQPFIASVIVSDINGKTPIVWARGLRNAVFLTIKPNSDQVWGTEMGRDFLGDSTPPDEVNIIQNGDFGWPKCYGQRIPDTEFNRNLTAADCAKTIPPMFEIPAHSAPLGLTFIPDHGFPSDWKGDLLVAYHGSWNRSSPTGYKVVHMKLNGGKISQTEDFITGFLLGNTAVGRPVDVEFDKSGALYLSDDKNGRIYKITYAQ